MKKVFISVFFALVFVCMSVSCDKDPVFEKGQYAFYLNEGMRSVASDEAAKEIIASMVYVEGGAFQMGGTSEQGSDAYDDESPVHMVTVSSFHMGETEVTQRQWSAIMGNNPSSIKGDNLPVESVSWYDCQEFIQKLNQLTGKNFRLPTEAEWEYAARGGNRSSGYKYSGSNSIGSVAWYNGNSSSITHPVKTKSPNELGFYDMSGNVSEWCSDWYSSYGSSVQINPSGPASGSSRVLRGGSWDDHAKYCRVSYRCVSNPDNRNSSYGFRLVLVLQSPGDESIVVAQEIMASMKYVEGGTFQMGGTSEQGSDAYDDESPVHMVTVSSFHMGETEVTQRQWSAIMGNNPSSIKGDNLPVESVSWYDCQEFIQKLNQLTGKNFRLPTEAEWEYAARGGNRSSGYKYSGSSGSISIDDVAWYDGNSDSKTHPVRSKSPNELGLYDMSGNVWEWCSDWYGGYGSSAQINPSGPASGSNRVFRGGSWYAYARSCRVSYRLSSNPGTRSHDRGFRLVMVLQSPDDESIVIAQDIIASMKYVEGGTFQMGGTSEQGSDAYGDESPVHTVKVSSFYMGETEVTQRQWSAIMGSNPSSIKGDNLPVESVSWDDCQEFIQKLNQLTGLTFRLPTEAEWEYAARGGRTKGYKYSGGNSIGILAWYDGNSDSRTHPVKTKSPNELGLYDMSGNVWEWCSDWYGSYGSSAQINPSGPASGSCRMLRGGSWRSDVRNCRVSNRGTGSPDCRNNNYGFRLSLVP